MKRNALSHARVSTCAAAGVCIALSGLSGTAPATDHVTVTPVPADQTAVFQTVFQVPWEQTVFVVPYEQTVFEVPESQTVFTVEADALRLHDSPYITFVGPRNRADAALHLADGLWLLSNDATASLAVALAPGRLQVIGSGGDMTVMYAGYTDEDIIAWIMRDAMSIADDEHLCRCRGNGFVSFAYCSDDAFCSCDEFDDHIRAQCLTISEQ